MRYIVIIITETRETITIPITDFVAYKISHATDRQGALNYFSGGRPHMETVIEIKR